MRIGAPKEIKDNEYRVSLTPAAVSELVQRGHAVLVEKGAGVGAGLSDAAYEAAGASLADGPGEIFETADLIVKVKEPQPQERERLRPGQTLFTYLHLAADRRQTLDLARSGAICIAYETVTSPFGGLPLLAPMSEVAGRLAPQVGARCLEKPSGGRGVLLAGVPGVPAAEVVILGGGTVGTQAAMIALGMGANVIVADRSGEALRRLAARFGNTVRTIFSTPTAIAELVKRADIPNLVKLALAARARGRLRLQHLLTAREVLGQRTDVAARLLPQRLAQRLRRSCIVVGSCRRRDAGLKIAKLKCELLGH